MIDIDTAASDVVSGLVAALPEKYQPIFAHPELSDGSSRDCQDRLVLIRDCVRLLQARLRRGLRILDLGCAQGYFSLNLAADGHSVRGVDFLESNVAVCQALALEQGLDNATFECASVEDVLDGLQADQYDLVLGLSVFHHLVHVHGVAEVRELFTRLSIRIAVGIYEMALREEPLYWGLSQPQHPAELLEPYVFRRVLAYMPTHLSGIERPLYVASSRYWFVGDNLSEIRDWRAESHPHAMGSHQGTRRYMFGDGVLLKQYAFDNATLGSVNVLEYEREVAFLTKVPEGLVAPKLLDHGQDGRNAWILREMLPGRLLSEIMAAHTPYPLEHVLDSLLDQLVALEDVGLYHNDVRCWNLLIAPGKPVALIDYGAISPVASDCVWPDNLFLALLITFREIVQGHVMRPYPVRRPLLDVALLPTRYRNAFLGLFALPKTEWRFRLLRQFAAEPGEQPLPSWTALGSSFEQALLEYERAIDASSQQRAAVEWQLQESLANAHHWFELAGQRELALSDASRHTETTVAEMAERQQHELEQLVQRYEASTARIQAENSAFREESARELSAARYAREEEVRALRAEQAQLVEMLQSDVTEALANTEAHRIEAIRQSERARSALVAVAEMDGRLLEARTRWMEIEGSTTWRMMYPARLAVKFLRQLRSSPRHAAREAILALMRPVLRNPTAGPALNSVVKHVPALHVRLRRMAVGRGMVVEEPVFQLALDPFVLGQARSLDEVHEGRSSQLSSRGRKILKRLEESMKGGRQ